MTPSEIEQRLATYDEKIASLEREVMATETLVQLLIGSHHEPSVLLSYVQATIQTARTKNVAASKRAALDRVIARLEDVEKKVQAAKDDRERARQNAAVEVQRQRAAHEVQRREAQAARDREDEDNSPGMGM
ncbi:hypothetical protein IMCGPPIG_01896 [Stenotrophomonas maltophilia]|nr:hypothetical protein XY58_09755 [Stenotrophomonas maltophilia]MBA0255747.1 hypothetical protein [Stenotrophomonas maltophilia]MBA0452112.1 hypothetical protein [Stenotrophomonas maltophilia]MBA0480434.1 hypothetical protein [Stenotrophomonas maltophilia]MBA0489718.1 hypothetical protein [Stenotrophomonas maltophilia]